ncbi:MAG TPA: NAD(P)/FAD-dependent oxidoreductase [Actinomycetes bacterium]|nr:NAD(P)/FAD-dependent oxidoreductase [Actinomycetes bacterium]
MVQEVDVVVIGLGVGGEDLAGKLAESGLEVVGVERQLVGGECPYWGCVPSKMMIRAADLLAEGRRIPGMAGQSRVTPDYSPVAARIRDEATDDWDDTVAADRLVDKGATLVRGVARLTGPGEVTVGDQVFTTRRGVVVAAGTTPSIPPVDGLADTPYWTNRDAIEAKEPPGSLIVLGGGAIGAELAQVFARFGSQVSIVDLADQLVPMEEPEVGELLEKVLTDEGLTIRTGVTVSRVSHDGSVFTVDLGDERLTAEQLLVATGRRVDLGSLGVDSIGLDPQAPSLEVDEHMRAGEKLWAIGDVTGKGAFTHVAMYQSAIAARSILGEDGPPAQYRATPRVTFTDPEIGAVGLTEAQAREKGVRVRTGTTQIPSSARGWIHKAGNEGLVKLVEDVDRGVLVGATSVGPNGGEVLGALAVAVHAEVGTDQLAQMMYAYPTFHRAIEDALRDLREQSGDG